MRALLRSLRSKRTAGSHDHSNGAETRLLLPVALRVALALASFDGDSGPSHRSRNSHRRSRSSSISIRRRREELAPPSDRSSNRSVDRNNPGNLPASRGIHPLEPAHERLERRSGTGKSSAWYNRASATGRARFSSQAVPQLPFHWGKWRGGGAYSRRGG